MPTYETLLADATRLPVADRIQLIDALGDTDLIETNADFRALVEKSAASARKPFGADAASPN